MSSSWAAALKRAGRVIHFPNFPLRLVAPKVGEAEKGMDVVTFITVPKTTKVRAAPACSCANELG